jgi:glycosyltransferase involved in cell wall biosynthesis
MKIAIVHDYLVNRGGAERVVAAWHRIWPDAPIYTSLYHPEATYEAYRNADVRTSWLQRFSRDPARFRRMLPLFPSAFARFDLRGYDVVLASSSGFAHHVRAPSGATFIVYSYSPPRFLYDDRYDTAGVAPGWASPMLPLVRARLRALDRRAASRVQKFLAVSGVAAARLRARYGVDATVVYPPVDVSRFRVSAETDDQHLVVGRLLPYRNTQLAVRAFTQMGRRLVVIGDGPARAALQEIAGPTVEFRGVVSEEELVDAYARSRAVVVPGVEDLGLAPLEANASGRPAIALGEGGARETIRDGETGLLFTPATPRALSAAVERASAISFDPDVLRAHASRFDEASFARLMREAVEQAVASGGARSGVDR